MGRNAREEAARGGAGGSHPSLVPPRRVRVTPLLVRQLRQLRTLAPWLGVRRLARGFGLTVHQVREIVAGRRVQFDPLRRAIRCRGCGAMIRVFPCVRCTASGQK
jgi:hypothetical protein